jgi:hypothetical protein
MSTEKSPYFVGDANAGFGDPEAYRREQAQKRDDTRKKTGRPLMAGWSDAAEPPRSPSKEQRGGFANKDLGD